MIKIEQKTVRRRNKRVWYFIRLVFVAVFVFSFLVQRGKVLDKEVEAVNPVKFDPGYIISDYQMSNYNSMDESQIQAFLKSKNSCNDTSIGRYTVGEKVGYFSEMSPPRTWHIKDGHFVCMADEVFDGGTAAHIVYQAAQDYRINPQVLLVLLEKEQSLVRDTFPHSQQYRSATGYGCPDTAECSSKYYGLKNQIRNAAELFRIVLDGGWTNYPLGNNYIQYNPNASCGGSVVNIRNLATSALYRYTPYQPNAVTLAGGSDNCSAYGNLNFYRYFEDWFGGSLKTYTGMRVPDGTYYIRMEKEINKVIDVYANRNINGTNIQVFEKNDSDAQKWYLKYNSATQDYTIFNTLSGKALDVEGAGIEDGTNIQLWESNETCAQRWKIVDKGNGSVAFLSACSEKAISVEDVKKDESPNIAIMQYQEKTTQGWNIIPVNSLEKDGLYTIQSRVNEKKVIDISGGINNARNGTNIQIWNNNNTGAQRWQIEKTNDGYYRIVNYQSKKTIDVVAGLSSDGANIQIWDNNNSCAQKWSILKNDNYYTFISACSNKVIDLEAGLAMNGQNIQLYGANDTKAQQWLLKEIDVIKDGEYEIASVLDDNKVIDINANQNLNGTNIQIWESNGTVAQKWNIKYDPKSDYYNIVNPNTKKALDVEAAGISKGTNIHLWSTNNTCAQKWTIYDGGNNSYIISSACSNLVLDVDGAKKQNGTNVQLWEANGTKAQKWSLKKL